MCVCMYFSWDDCDTPGENETMVMQNFGGLTRCIMVYVKIMNSYSTLEQLNHFKTF